MLPLLKQNRDLVYIVGKEECDFGISDVVLYKRGEQLVLHRIIDKNGLEYVVLGDNQYISENILENQIIGVMTAILRDGKEILREDSDYQRYVSKIMKISMSRRKILAKIRRII